ncbi:uncharacterized protein [Physcomitrium patens]|uniref:Uncharacterized protein n=1 Tax=Physcomitrium patens TaxID=3218 RepID=A0A2K1LAK3_PHYPA|nr:uncharacterized protein LOC112280328 [Physcomitrium patens]PNR63061.1 hypothetical protein PHYPA_001486 [Physcomitrium patens]|eukprot:XP_024371470.1 uncharacterized protein LOC112280328 [Physcomitrella patens]
MAFGVVSIMATRRVTWSRAVRVHPDLSARIRRECDENVNRRLGDNLNNVRGIPVLNRCSRCHLRIPLRDITHLFQNNVAPVDDKVNSSSPAIQALGSGPVRGLLPESVSSQNSRKRRHTEPVSESSTERRVLRKFR